MENLKRHTFAILVANETGVLSQITRLFSRKGYNIESVACGTTTDPAISRITIEIISDERQAELLCNQLRKVLLVHSVKILEPTQSIRRELVLIKVRAATREIRNEVIQIANIFRGSVIDVCAETITISLIGAEEKTEAVETLLQEFGVEELVRTGIIALERGRYTIDENTKEKGEFDYGKNVL